MVVAGCGSRRNWIWGWVVVAGGIIWWMICLFAGLCRGGIDRQMEVEKTWKRELFPSPYPKCYYV
ncbi:hypothetical protein HanIR_Chr01g0027621 [Helianthus annuus]|nr:hypothetical protein HanIR_Chr01g0027621 [Helianthus annuus]